MAANAIPHFLTAPTPVLSAVSALSNYSASISFNFPLLLATA